MSGFIKQIKTTRKVCLSKLNLQMTEFQNFDSRKMMGFDVAWIKKWENFKPPLLIFC